MRHGRSLGVGATIALAAALAACSPVDSLDEEETSSSEETASESTSDAGAAAPQDEESTTDEPPEAPTDEPTEDASEAPTEDEGEQEPEEEGSAEVDGEVTTVEHDAGTVTYVLPETWNDLSFAYQGHPTIVLAAAPLETAANGSQVTLTAVEGGAGSFEAYREALEEQRPEGATMTDAEPLTVEGEQVPGLRVEMDTPQGPFVQYTYPIFDGGYQWELQFAMDAGDEDADHPQMRTVAESLTID